MLIDRAEEFKTNLRSRLTPERFEHSLNVASSAAQLAKIWGEDKDKAYIAGLLHDCTKNETNEMQLNFFRNDGIILSQVEQNNPKLWHAMSAPIYAKMTFGIDDENILGALRFHTTGKAGMTLLEKIVYIADYISAERNYPDVDAMRRLALISLDKAALYSLKYSLNKLSATEKPIHPDSLAFYNELITNKVTVKEII